MHLQSLTNRALAPIARLSTSPHSSSRARRRLGDTARLAYQGTALTDHGYALSAYGVWLAERPSDATYVFSLTGAYGDGIARWLRRQRRPFAFLDIGANIGLFSLLAARNAHCVRLDAFEPDPDTLPFLRHNLERVRPGLPYQVHPVALAGEPGEARLNRLAGHSGASTLRRTAGQADDPTVTIVDHHYLDADLIAAEGVPIIVKVDVEGGEWSALDQLRQWSRWPAVEQICVELDRSFTDVDAVIRLLHSSGFSEFRTLGTSRRADVIFRRETI